MDVKEINNSAAAVQAMFSKAVANAGSGQSLGAGFANLIQQTGDILANPAEAREPKAAPAADKAVKPTSEKAVDRKAAPKETEQAKDSKPAKRKEKSAPDAAAIEARPAEEVRTAAAPRSTSAVAEADAVETSVPAAVADETAPVVMPQAEAEPQMQNLPTFGLQQLEAAGAIAVLSEDMLSVLLPQVDLSALAQQPQVSVFDTAANQIATMTGAEFVDKLQQAAAQDELYVVSGEMPAERLAVLPAMLKRPDAADSTVFEPTEVEPEALPQSAAPVAEQAALLDSKLRSERRIEVKVAVEEEKFSYTDTNQLVQDKVVLDEVVRAALEDVKPQAAETKAGSKAETLVSAPLAPQNQDNNAAPQTLTMPAASMTLAAEPAMAAESAASTAVENVAAVTGQTSGQVLSGAATAAAVRAESAPRPVETSFRDVYKGLSSEVVEQVKVNITKSAVKGVDTIEVKLNPRELGDVEIKMQIGRDGKLTAHIVTSRPETMEALKEDAAGLEQAFNEAGFRMDEGALSFGSRGGQEAETEHRSFIGRALEHGTAEVAGNDNGWIWTPEKGLNIKV